MSTILPRRVNKDGKFKTIRRDIPLLCAYLIATLPGLLLAVPLILTTFPTLVGSNHAAAKLCIPPIDEPTLAYNLSTPRLSNKQNCARTMSKILTTGKLVPYRVAS
jgi:hypothetical protein